MELRTQTSLIVALVAVAIGISVLLRPRKNRVHWAFGGMSFAIAAWYLTGFLQGLLEGDLWPRANLICAVLLPLAAVRFFQVFAPGERASVTLNRVAWAAAAVLAAFVFTPAYAGRALAASIFVYVFALLAGALGMLWRAARSAPSRFDRARMSYLTVMGALAATFTLVDYLPLVGLDIPPVGSVLTLVFLYIISQSIVRFRLIDMYELAGRLGVLTAVSFTLAFLFWLLVSISGTSFFLHSAVAALIVLLVYDPVRLKVEEKISQFFFRERYALEQALLALRRRIAHVLEVDHLADIVLTELERSRRLTHGALYLVDDDMRSYRLRGHVGPPPPQRIELAPARPMLDMLEREPVLVLENVGRNLEEHRARGEDREAETAHEIMQAMEAMQADLVLGLRGEQHSLGVLCIRDDRMGDAFTPEEVSLLAGLAAQIATTVENSRVHQRMKERDRLAMMGEMSASLAHEIRNPLGAIKASAQYLSGGPSDPAANQEFLDIIVDEADRLNRVVSNFLDYAHAPSLGTPTPTDVNAVVQRTAQVLDADVQLDLPGVLKLAPNLPSVNIDPEQLRQVLINLVQNALQAVEEGGTLRIETEARELPNVDGEHRRWVDIRVIDTGPGIPQQVLKNMFDPFVTTRTRGTGLGLAISQRIVRSAGGRIDVRTREQHGSTFTVRLPVPAPTEPQSEAGLPGSATRPSGAPVPAVSEPPPAPEGAALPARGSGPPSTGKEGVTAAEASTPGERPSGAFPRDLPAVAEEPSPGARPEPDASESSGSDTPNEMGTNR